jgi:hypothetical protein
VMASSPAALAASEEAARYIESRRAYEQYRCESVKLMREQGDAANAEQWDKAKEILKRRMDLMNSAVVVKLEDQMRDSREKLMAAHDEADIDEIRKAEFEIRANCAR